MRRIIAATLITAGFLGGCVGPSRTDGDYKRKTAESAEVMISLVESARLVSKLGAEGKAFAPYVSLQLSEAETDAGSVITAYASVQPPSRSADRLRSEALDVLDAAHAQLEELRIAAFRAELDELSELVEPLADIVERLKRFEDIAPT